MAERGQAHPVHRAVQVGRRIVYSAQFAAAVAAFFFALSATIVRGVREDVPPIGLSFWRTLLGFVLILPIFMRPIRVQAGLLLRHWRILSLLAFLLVIAGNALLYLSLQFTVVINVVVLNSVEPVLILAVAWLIFRDPVIYRQTFGIPYLFRQAGLDIHAIVPSPLHPSFKFTKQFMEAPLENARKRGEISAEELEIWWEDMERMNRKGRFYSSQAAFIVLAVKP